MLPKGPGEANPRRNNPSTYLGTSSLRTSLQDPLDNIQPSECVPIETTSLQCAICHGDIFDAILEVALPACLEHRDSWKKARISAIKADAKHPGKITECYHRRCSSHLIQYFYRLLTTCPIDNTTDYAPVDLIPCPYCLLDLKKEGAWTLEDDPQPENSQDTSVHANWCRTRWRTTKRPKILWDVRRLRRVQGPAGDTWALWGTCWRIKGVMAVDGANARLLIHRALKTALGLDVPTSPPKENSAQHHPASSKQSRPSLASGADTMKKFIFLRSGLQIQESSEVKSNLLASIYSRAATYPSCCYEAERKTYIERQRAFHGIPLGAVGPFQDIIRIQVSDWGVDLGP